MSNNEKETKVNEKYAIPYGFMGAGIPAPAPDNNTVLNSTSNALEKYLDFATVNQRETGNGLADQMISNLSRLYNLSSIMDTMVKPKVDEFAYAELTRGVVLMFDELQKMTIKAFDKQ